MYSSDFVKGDKLHLLAFNMIFKVLKSGLYSSPVTVSYCSLAELVFDVTFLVHNIECLYTVYNIHGYVPLYYVYQNYAS